MRNPERQAARDLKIKQDYAVLVAKKIYCKAYMMEQLADTYFLTPSTIESIIYGAYDARRKRVAANSEGQIPKERLPIVSSKAKQPRRKKMTPVSTQALPLVIEKVQTHGSYSAAFQSVLNNQ